MKKEDDYAVVVGITDYPNAPLNNLGGPENDAAGFQSWLLSATGGNLPAKNVHAVLSSQFPGAGPAFSRKPMTSEITAEFDAIMADLNGRPARRLYLFYAGHGIALRTGLAAETDMDESAILMANAGEDRWGYNIPGNMFAQSFRAAAVFQEIVLIMDCCRDTMKNAAPFLPPWGMGQKLDALGVKRFYGFATKWSRQSRERPFGANVEGIFSHSVLAALNSGRLTSKQLKDFVINDMDKNLHATQQPDFPIPDAEASAIVFSEDAPAARLPVKITFAPALIDHDIVVIDGQSLRVRYGFRATVNPWQEALEIGRYSVQDVTPGIANGKSIVIDVLGGPQDVQF